jgi:Tol biopolymer transport system component
MPHAKSLWSGLVLVIVACGDGTEPPDSATADIKADDADGPVTVSAHVPVHLSWSSVNATSCQVSPGGWNGTTGSAAVEDLTGTTTYRLSCTGPGAEAEDSVQIIVTPPGTEIVFESRDSTTSNIYVVNADGSGLTRLTAGGVPSWSGDGRQIYFASQGGLYAMNADGTGVHLVVDSINGLYAVSPDGTRIAFGALAPPTAGSTYPNVDLFVMHDDGSERTRIVDLPCDFIDYNCWNLEAMDWSPDGQRIAYSAGSFGHAGYVYGFIGIVNADGSGDGRLNTSNSRSTDPAWSPDGQRIVYASGDGSTIPYPTGLDLEIINADGTGRVVVLQSGAEITSPSWSPDGQSIVFARYTPAYWAPAEPSEMLVINVDGTGLRSVADTPGEELAPDWNPAAP